MILTIKNQVSGIRSYLGGLVTVADGGQTTIPRSLNVLLISDAQFLSDLGSNGPINIILNNQVKDLNPGEALELAKVLSNFTTDPIAMMPIYYTAPVKITQTGATNANSTVWSMRNTSGVKIVVLERLFLNAVFDNTTPLGVDTLIYDLRRFSAATPTGGATVSVIQMDNSGPATAVTDVRVLDTGLTVAGVSFENPFAHIPCPEIRGGNSSYIRNNMSMKLAPGEGLCIRLSVASVNGQSLYGEVIWSER